MVHSLVKFVPYDEDVHRAQFFALNVEYLTWFVDEAFARHNIDVTSLSGQTVQEYVETFLDDFVKIRPSKGIIYLLAIEGNVVGMGALRELEKRVGEIKRMYIRPEYRGRGFGKELVKRLIDKGREFGYSTLRLDTADFMTVAHNVYRSAGFKEIDCYSGCETPEWYQLYCIFMEKTLETKMRQTQ